MQKTMIIEGMMCEHCKSNVIKALSAVEGVAAVDVDLAQKRAAVTLQKPVADDVLRNAVTDAGYTVTQM